MDFHRFYPNLVLRQAQLYACWLIHPPSDFEWLTGPDSGGGEGAFVAPEKRWFYFFGMRRTKNMDSQLPSHGWKCWVELAFPLLE